ncbi:MAG: hypothetical protein K2R98_20790 [Gemmataceae bacterium]|nr:hypothetical protein [Gemmataceae bacterium]
MDLNALKDALRRQPFRPFVMRLADGRQLHVPHPDFVATSARQVVVINPQDESLSILEPLLIVSLEIAGSQPAGKPQGAS